MGTDAASRARAWVHENQAAVCDVIEPWEHGTVVRASVNGRSGRVAAGVRPEKITLGAGGGANELPGTVA